MTKAALSRRRTAFPWSVWRTSQLAGDAVASPSVERRSARSFSSETSAIEAVNLGVAGYLRKPFRVPEVLAAAAKALGVPAA